MWSFCVIDSIHRPNRNKNNHIWFRLQGKIREIFKKKYDQSYRDFKKKTTKILGTSPVSTASSDDIELKCSTIKTNVLAEVRVCIECIEQNTVQPNRSCIFCIPFKCSIFRKHEMWMNYLMGCKDCVAVFYSFLICFSFLFILFIFVKTLRFWIIFFSFV